MTGLFIHITTDPIEDHITLPGPDRENIIEHFANGSGKGRNKKVVMHSLAGFFGGACLHEKQQYQWNCALLFSYFLEAFAVGSSFIVMPSFFPFHD